MVFWSCVFMIYKWTFCAKFVLQFVFLLLCNSGKIWISSRLMTWLVWLVNTQNMNTRKMSLSVIVTCYLSFKYPQTCNMLDVDGFSVYRYFVFCTDVWVCVWIYRLSLALVVCSSVRNHLPDKPVFFSVPCETLRHSMNHCFTRGEPAQRTVSAPIDASKMLIARWRFMLLGCLVYIMFALCCVARLRIAEMYHIARQDSLHAQNTSIFQTDFGDSIRFILRFCCGLSEFGQKLCSVRNALVRRAGKIISVMTRLWTMDDALARRNDITELLRHSNL